MLRERVEAMKAIWTNDEASYQGEFVRFERIWSWPKPEQKPHPPVMIGGNGPRVVERVLAYGDEWIPEPEEGLAERMRELSRRSEEVGRDVPITVYGVRVEDVEGYEAAGAHRCVHWLPPGDVDRTRSRLRELAEELRL